MEQYANNFSMGFTPQKTQPQPQNDKTAATTTLDALAEERAL